MTTEKTRKSVGWYVLCAWILFLYFFACYYMIDSKKETLHDEVDITIPQDFHSRLKKHGLDKQVSIVEIARGKLYFYRDGKKCNF